MRRCGIHNILRGASQLQKSTSTPACILRKRVDLPGNLFYDSCTQVRKVRSLVKRSASVDRSNRSKAMILTSFRLH